MYVNEVKFRLNCGQCVKLIWERNYDFYYFLKSLMWVLWENSFKVLRKSDQKYFFLVYSVKKFLYFRLHVQDFEDSNIYIKKIMKPHQTISRNLGILPIVNFFYREPYSTLFRFYRLVVFVGTTQLCLCSSKASTENTSTNEYNCFLIKLYAQ